MKGKFKLPALFLALAIVVSFIMPNGIVQAEEENASAEEILTVDVSLNTQFVDKDGNYSRIPNAVSKAVNTETGEEFIFEMDAEGNIPHLQLPAGTYEMSLVSLPDGFAEGKRLDISFTDTDTIEEPYRNQAWKVLVREIPTVDVSLNTQFVDKDGNYSRIPNAVSKAVNTETGEEFIFEMDAEGNIPHLQLPAGTYEMSLVSLPDGFAEGKRLDISFIDTDKIEEPYRNQAWKVTVKEIPTYDVSLNTQFVDKDGNYSRIPNAVSKAVNTETGEEFIFEMDAEGNIPHLRLPEGTYEMSLVSLPDGFAEGKRLDLSFTDTATVTGPDNGKGWKVLVRELPAEEEPEVPGEEPEVPGEEPGTTETTGENPKETETTKPSESKKDDSDLTKTGQSENLLFVGLASLLVAGYLVVKRREDLN